MAKSENPIMDQLGSDFEVAPEPEEKPEQKPKEDEPKKYRFEVDLEDGSGKQVFEADTEEGLAKQFEKAQRNATKKIKDLNRKLKAAREAKEQAAKVVIPDVEALSGEDDFLLAQEFSQTPSKALAKLFEKMTGVPLSEIRSIKQQMSMMEAARAEAAEAQEFLAEHAEDYNPTPGNYRKLQAYLDENDLPLNRENLEEAFEEVKDDLRPFSKSDEKDPEEKKPRIEESKPAKAPTVKKASSGLSDRSGRREPSEESHHAAVTDEEIMNLPLDQARERIARAMREQARSSSR